MKEHRCAACSKCNLIFATIKTCHFNCAVHSEDYILKNLLFVLIIELNSLNKEITDIIENYLKRVELDITYPSSIFHQLF